MDHACRESDVRVMIGGRKSAKVVCCCERHAFITSYILRYGCSQLEAIKLEHIPPRAVGEMD